MLRIATETKKMDDFVCFWKFGKVSDGLAEQSVKNCAEPCGQREFLKREAKNPYALSSDAVFFRLSIRINQDTE